MAYRGEFARGQGGAPLYYPRAVRTMLGKQRKEPGCGFIILKVYHPMLDSLVVAGRGGSSSVLPCGESPPGGAGASLKVAASQASCSGEKGGGASIVRLQ